MGRVSYPPQNCRNRVNQEALKRKIDRSSGRGCIDRFPNQKPKFIKITNRNSIEVFTLVNYKIRGYPNWGQRCLRLKPNESIDTYCEITTGDETITSEVVSASDTK